MKKYSPITLVVSGLLSATLLISPTQNAHAQAADAPPAPTADQTQTTDAPATALPTPPVIRVSPSEAPKAAQDTFNSMLLAIKDNNRAKFVAQADANFKAALTPLLFQAVVDQAKPRLQSGYQTFYLGEMKKAGFVVHLWKLSFSKGGDDVLVQMSLKSDQVGGFFLS